MYTSQVFLKIIPLVNSNINVSIVVASYNRKEGVLRMLASLEKQTFKRFELVLIDDFSIIPLAEFVKLTTYSFNIKLLRNEKNSGPAFSRNRGIENSKSEYILFTDDDCVLDENWVHQMYEAIYNSGEKIAGFAGKTNSFRRDVYGKYYEKRKFLNPLNAYKGGDVADGIVTANCIMKKSLILKVNGFNEKVKVAGGEDTELYYKIIQNDYKFLYLPKAIVWHEFASGVFAMYKMLYRYGIGLAMIEEIIPLKERPFDSNRKWYKRIYDQVNILPKIHFYKENYQPIGISFLQMMVFDFTIKIGKLLGYHKGKKLLQN